MIPVMCARFCCEVKKSVKHMGVYMEKGTPALVKLLHRCGGVSNIQRTKSAPGPPMTANCER